MSPSACRSRSRTRRERAEEFARGIVTGGTLFEELGFYYVGPIDGHNLDHLLPVLKNVRDTRRAGPVLVHVVTQKGKGYPPAEESADKYHGVTKFDVVTGAQVKVEAEGADLHQGVRRSADRGGRARRAHRRHHRGDAVGHRPRPVRRALSRSAASMSASPSSMRVTFAAGLATEGFKPFAAIYSTFLQRAYDQVVHDVAIQKLPVRFAIDRAGLVGADGADACRLLRRRLSRLPARLRGHGGGRRGRARAHGGDRGGDRRPARRRSAIRAARASACALPAARRRRCRSARAASLREGTKVALLSLRRASAGMPEGGRRAGRARPVDDGRRRALRQAARRPIWSAAWRASTRC